MMFPFEQNNQQMYQNYAQAANSGDYSQIDPNQAYGHVQQFMQNAPPEMQQQTYQQYFQQMPQDQRQQFAQQMPPQYQQMMNPNNPQQMAQGFHQMAQQQPDMLHQILGPGGMLSNPIAKMAVAGLAAVAAKNILGGGGLHL